MSELPEPLTVFSHRATNYSLVKRRKPGSEFQTFTHKKAQEPETGRQLLYKGCRALSEFPHLPSTLQWGHWDQDPHSRSQRDKAGTQKVFSSLAGWRRCQLGTAWVLLTLQLWEEKQGRKKWIVKEQILLHLGAERVQCSTERAAVESYFHSEVK